MIQLGLADYSAIFVAQLRAHLSGSLLWVADPTLVLKLLVRVGPKPAWP